MEPWSVLRDTIQQLAFDDDIAKEAAEATGSDRLADQVPWYVEQLKKKAYLEGMAAAINSPWGVDDLRMWREQCRVGDVAFQHLFCTSKGKPMPDWVTEGLPKMYSTLEEIKKLREEVTKLKVGIAEAAKGLEASAQPFDSACVTLRNLLTK